MKRGEVYLAEIKEYRSESLMVKVVETEILLPAAEIKDGIKQKHKKMVGWYIPVRVQSLRPFAVSNMRIDKDKLVVWTIMFRFKQKIETAKRLLHPRKLNVQ